MLGEWLRYLTTPCPKPIRAMGYLRELIGISSRHARCIKAWEPHLEQSRDAILAAAARCERRESALILGAALWHDVPVAELSKRFERVVMADILHLPATRRRARNFPNVELLTVDATGAMDRTYADARPSPPCPPGLGAFDLAVSVNLASQLPILPRRWLEDRGWEPERLDPWSRQLIESHLAWLRHTGTVACLICDVERQSVDADGTVKGRDTVYGLAPPVADREWVWNLAPRPEQDPHHDIRLRVRAVIDLNAATT